jgi:hypothetical protein
MDSPQTPHFDAELLRYLHLRRAGPMETIPVGVLRHPGPPADLRREARAAHAECVHRAQSMLKQVFAIAEKSSVKDSVPADWA